MKIAVIPAHNEANSIRNVVEKVKPFVDRVIVVNDGSTDNTKEVLKEITSKQVLALEHIVNLGKGAALKTGCDFAAQQGALKIVVLDADGQHKPEMIPVFFKALEGNDIVYGYRRLSKNMPFVLRFGNQAINKTLSILFGTQINDSQSGYRAFTTQAYKKIRWNASDYYMETEMAINAARNKLRQAQVEIETIYADRYKGTTVLDGVKIVLKMITARLFK